MQAYGIPTYHRNIKFRSRLEARWAAFFDLLGWSWIYEPFDLPGWIPDFMLNNKVLVEVKPFANKEEWHQETLNIIKAISQTKRTEEVLLLGVDPFRGVTFCDDIYIFGYMLSPSWQSNCKIHDEYCDCDQDYSYECKTMSEKSEEYADNAVCITQSGLYDLSVECGHWCSRFDFFKSHKWYECNADKSDLEAKWGIASNQTQWKR